MERHAQVPADGRCDTAERDTLIVCGVEAAIACGVGARIALGDRAAGREPSEARGDKQRAAAAGEDLARGGDGRAVGIGGECQGRRFRRPIF